MSSMTLVLNDTDEVVVQRLMLESNLNKTQLLRCALRFYQLVAQRTRSGHELAFVKDGVYIPVIVVGPGLSPWEGDNIMEKTDEHG